MANAIEDLEGMEFFALLAVFFGILYVLYKYLYCPYISTSACGSNNPIDPTGTNTGLGSGVTVGTGATSCTMLGCTGNYIGSEVDSLEEWWNSISTNDNMQGPE